MALLLRQLFQRALFELGGQPISLLWLLKLMVALFVVALLTRLIKNFLKHRLLARLGLEGGNREAIATLVSLGLGAFGYLVVLQATGIDLSSLAVIIGGLGVGIGFGLQDIAKNLLSGLTVLVERKLKVGDFIEFDGVVGYIEEISIRSTVIRQLGGGEVIIPNAQLAEERITNWSYRDFCGRLNIEVGVAYGSDLVLVTETLLAAAYSLPEIRSEPSPKVIFVGFGDSALNFELWVWIERFDRRPLIQSNLNFAVEYYLRRRGINIPFPQLDLWVKDVNSTPKPATTDSDTTDPSIAPNPPNESLRDRLSQVSYFQQFNELQLRSLIELGFRQQLAADEVLIRQGERAGEFCIVLSGAIAALHESDQQTKQIFTFGTGQYFGELPLMLNVPYPTTMRAIGTTTLFVINEAGFRTLLRQYPALAEEIAEELARRKEVLAGYKTELRALGMTAETEQNPVAWLRQRLQEMWGRSLG
ncbi:MAG: mechanosensitive ion channel domain-containing protein [Cyanobacteria bacterium P01_G01_bin.54]